VVQTDGVAQWWQQSAREELDALVLLKAARARKESLKPIAVFLHGSGATALGELEHRGGSEGRPEPQVQQLLEVRPVGCAVILLDLREPQLCHVVEMVGGSAHLVIPRGSVLEEVGVTLVKEEHRIGCAVVAGEIPLLGLGVELVAVTTVVAVVIAPSRGRLGLLLLGHLRFNGGDLGVHGLEHLEDLGEGWLGHGGRWVGRWRWAAGFGGCGGG
jgi:hypothetical protein